MSEFAREALPIFFMYGVVMLLGPLVGITMWMAFDGDRLHTEDVAAGAEAEQPAKVDTQVATGRPATAA